MLPKSANRKLFKKFEGLVIFFFEIQKLTFFQRNHVFFFLLAFINLFQLLVGYVFKSNERSEDSYIGLADFVFFFQEKVLK